MLNFEKRTVVQILGCAGAGKTSYLIGRPGVGVDEGSVLNRLLARHPGLTLMDVGFVSFTRAARAEACRRAAEQSGGDFTENQLRRQGWFRTIHSVCLKQLPQVSQQSLLSDVKADRELIAEHVGGEVSVGGEIPGEQRMRGDGPGVSRAGACLSLWDLSRASLRRLDEIWFEASRVDPEVPPLKDVREAVRRYEAMKANHDRFDFTDLLALFAGWRFDPEEAPARVAPEGHVPGVPVWFLDEHQDASPLLHDAALRLTGRAWAVYFVGDPRQAVYGFAGADPSLLIGAGDLAHRKKALTRTHRCPSRIVDVAQHVLRRGFGQVDPIEARCEGGDVLADSWRGGWESRISATPGSWMVLARSNSHWRRMAARLDDARIPWKETRGDGGYLGPVAREVCAALEEVARTRSVTGPQWELLVKHLPVSHDGKDLVKRGVKTYAKRHGLGLEGEGRLILDDPALGHWGMLEGFVDLICPDGVECSATGNWTALHKDARTFARAAEATSPEEARNPRVSVGTIHSVKGEEAESVALLTSTSKLCDTGAELSRKASEEEHRLSHVAATRARERLLLIEERGTNRKLKGLER